jgi:hypothetical protein
MMIKILAVASLALGGYITVMNWYSIYASRRSDRNISPVPLVGAFFLVLGLLGFQQTKPYALAGILADYGTLALIGALPMLARESWTTSRFHLLHRFLSDAAGRRDDIRLFKRGIFTIKTDYNPPIPSNEHGALAVSLGRVGTWRAEGDNFCLEGYGDERMMRIKEQDGRFVTEEESYPDSNEYQHDRMGGLTLKQLT